MDTGRHGQKARGVFHLDTILCLVRADTRAKGNGLNWESNRESCTVKGQPPATAMCAVKNKLFLIGEKILLGDDPQTIPLSVITVP